MNVETGECQFLRLLFFDMLMDWFHLLIVSPKKTFLPIVSEFELCLLTLHCP